MLGCRLYQVNDSQSLRRIVGNTEIILQPESQSHLARATQKYWHIVSGAFTPVYVKRPKPDVIELRPNRALAGRSD